MNLRNRYLCFSSAKTNRCSSVFLNFVS